VASQITARVVFQDKVRFLGQASGSQSIVIDYPPPLGEDAGVRGGLELLLMSLAACAGQTVVPLLRRMQQTVEGFAVEARGQRRDEHPTVLTDIELIFTLRGAGLDRTAVHRAISLAESQYCPVWAMLRGGTRITTSVEFV
jgi:putative redox protein